MTDAEYDRAVGAWLKRHDLPPDVQFHRLTAVQRIDFHRSTVPDYDAMRAIADSDDAVSCECSENVCGCKPLRVDQRTKNEIERDRRLKIEPGKYRYTPPVTPTKIDMAKVRQAAIDERNSRWKK
jgi:hypothetical protein